MARLIELYQKLQDNPKIRWKDKARKKIEKGSRMATLKSPTCGRVKIPQRQNIKI
jgi:hypothetical protein